MEKVCGLYIFEAHLSCVRLRDNGVFLPYSFQDVAISRHYFATWISSYSSSLELIRENCASCSQVPMSFRHILAI
jgi:hypothetical protein